jgi:hypothetical protein
MTDDKKPESDTLGEIEKAFGIGMKFVKAADPIAKTIGRLFESQTAPAPPPPTFEPKCYVCQDTLKVVMNNVERSCPSCVVEQPKCLTCGGKGKVGNPGHEAACPICKGRR